MNDENSITLNTVEWSGSKPVSFSDYQEQHRVIQGRMDKLAKRLGVEKSGEAGIILYGYHVDSLIHAFLNKMEGKCS